jgi:transposase-like protein
MADSGVEGKGKKVTGRYGVLEKITIDGSEANAAAIRRYNRGHGTGIAIRQVKYLNNLKATGLSGEIYKIP